MGIGEDSFALWLPVDPNQRGEANRLWSVKQDGRASRHSIDRNGYGFEGVLRKLIRYKWGQPPIREPIDLVATFMMKRTKNAPAAHIYAPNVLDLEESLIEALEGIVFDRRERLQSSFTDKCWVPKSGRHGIYVEIFYWKPSV
jgi:hypothetical protein